MHVRSAQAHCVGKLSLTASASALFVMLAAGFPLPGASAAAQISPPNRSELVPPERRERRDGPTLSIDGEMERAPCALDRAEYADIRLTLQGAEFGGLEAVPGISLDEAYGRYVGRELPLSVLCDIRAEANAILRREGYLASVEIPQQNLGDGVADFRVIFGRLTALRVRGDAGPSERVVARYLDRLTGGEVFNTREAERYLLLADDLPGVDVRLSLRPAAGGEPGDLVGEIAVVRQRAVLDINVQNFGSNAIGRFGGLLRGELYDLTGLGDRTTVTFFSTAEFEEQQTLQLGHDFAVGGEGLRFGAGLTLSQTSPELGLAGLDIDSQTLLASVFANYPVIRTRRSSTFVEAGFEFVNQDVDANEVRLTEDRVRMIYARISGDWTDGESVRRIGGYTPFEPRWRAYYAAELRKGLDVFSASPDCRPNLLACLIGGTAPPSRVEADPTPLLLRYQAGAEYRPDPLLTFSLEARAQASDDPLPAFEEFAGGSFSIGRGYDPGAILGDSGVGGSFEVRYGSLAPEGPQALAWQPYVFTDVAWAWNEDPSRRPLNPDRLWSAGGGVRAAFGSMMQGDFLVAVPLERPDLAPERGDVRVMFSLTARLFPWRY
ncbi:MAG: ShlB/FhaC/HecB family hemolysin secretion/activation protein [Erythrobacter sp.]|uniref:ShlB/FhaC/HecB family hemolysin secretion/activation protein n=1 Tax=Erythrobacter sp. TaxID=1042 RepID=UPI0032EC1929